MLFELFSDIFTIRQNRLTRMDPRLKLCAAIAALCMSLLAANPLFPGSLFALCLAGAAALSIPIRHILLRFAAPASVAVMILALKTFMTGGKPIFAMTIGGAALTATEQGFDQGVLLSARVLGGVAVLQLLSFVTPAHDVFRAMMWMGAPRGWVELAQLMYRFTFDIFEKAADVASAQSVRMGYSTAGRGLSSAGTLAGAVLLGAMEKAERVEEALLARGYKGYFPSDPPPRLCLWQTAQAIGACGAMLALFFLLEAV